MKAIIYASELETIGCHAADFPDLETGGDLFGFWTHSGFPIIHVATGPGPRAQRTSTSFFQDESFLRDVGDTLRQHHGLQHIGEWHSHHRLGLKSPSGGDAHTVVRGIQRNDLNQFFLTIVTLRSRARGDVPSAHGYLFQRRRGADYASCGWVVLEGTSPARSDSRVESAVHVVPPRSSNVLCQARPRTTLEEQTATCVPLRPDSWARSPQGIALLKAVQQQFGGCDQAPLGVTPDGLVQVAMTLHGQTCQIIFGNRTSLEDAVATLQWTGPEQSAHFDGTLSEVISRVFDTLEGEPREQVVATEGVVEVSRERALVSQEAPPSEARAELPTSLTESSCCDSDRPRPVTGSLLRGVVDRLLTGRRAGILQGRVREVPSPTSCSAMAVPTCRPAVAPQSQPHGVRP
jgi:hypothetical protein